MPNFSLVHNNRVLMSAGSVIQSRYCTRLPSLVIQRVGPRPILPIKAGGAGGRFFSERRSGVAGSGSGAKPSPPVRCCGLALGGGPQSTGPEFSSPQASDPMLTLPATPLAAAVRPMFSRNFRLERAVDPIVPSLLLECWPAQDRIEMLLERRQVENRIIYRHFVQCTRPRVGMGDGGVEALADSQAARRGNAAGDLILDRARQLATGRE